MFSLSLYITSLEVLKGYNEFFMLIIVYHFPFIPLLIILEQGKPIFPFHPILSGMFKDSLLLSLCTSSSIIIEDVSD